MIEKLITDQLEHTRDPHWDLTSIELGLEPFLRIEGNDVFLTLRAGIPTSLLQTSLIPTLVSSLQSALPSYQIQIELAPSIRAHQTQMAGKGLRGVKNTIAIASGKGGVGKSTVSVNLATALSKWGARVGILDADIYGPSIPLLLGNASPVRNEQDHFLPAIAHGVQAMSIGYMAPMEQALIWRGPMLAKALLQLINLTIWDELDYLFIDLPPGTGDIQLSLVQKIPLTGAVIVTTPQTVATTDAQKAIMMFQKTNISILGVVENMSNHHCSQCGHEESLFGTGGAQQLCEKNDCLLLGQLPLDKQITADCEQGNPTALSAHPLLADPFLKLGLKTAIEIAKKPLNYADKFPPIVVE